MKPEQEIEDETEFCNNSRRYCIFMFSFPQTCPYERNKGSMCNIEDCGYCELRKLTPYAKKKLKLLQGSKQKSSDNEDYVNFRG